MNVGIKGQSDIQGHRPADGVAFYLEIKTPTEYAAIQSRIARGKTTRHDNDQINFLNQMRLSGAIAGFATSPQQAVDLVFGRERE